MLVCDGREAVEVVQSRITLHLAILDVHMPRLTGLEALEEIRKLQLPNLPCILMTAENNERIQQQALALADSPVLEKPFALQTLTVTVRDIMRRAHGFAL